MVIKHYRTHGFTQIANYTGKLQEVNFFLLNLLKHKLSSIVALQNERGNLSLPNRI